jgi:hypothetical protein
VARRSPASQCDRIAELAQTLAPLLEDAADAGARKSGGLEFVGRGRRFTDSDPTGTAALDPRRSQIRRAARQAALLVGQAELTLEEATGVIANGYLRLDREEWVRAVESGERRSVARSTCDLRSCHSDPSHSVSSALYWVRAFFGGRRYGTDFGDFLGRLGRDLDPNRYRRRSVYRNSFEAPALRTNQSVGTGASQKGGLKQRAAGS